MNKRDLIKLANTVKLWEKKAGKYFVLAEREVDPLGQKFYQSTAMAYANCANDIRLQTLLSAESKD